MIIYLKSGQIIDVGDVKYAIDSCGREFKAIKYAKNDEEVIGVCGLDNNYDSDDTLEFFNTNNEKLELKCNEIIGIREDVK